MHCMSWVVELDPRVLGDNYGMSFTASANGLSSVTGYELRATSVGLDFGHAFVFGRISILVSVTFCILVLLIVASVRPWLSVLFFWIRLLPYTCGNYVAGRGTDRQLLRVTAYVSPLVVGGLQMSKLKLKKNHSCVI